MEPGMFLEVLISPSVKSSLDDDINITTDIGSGASTQIDKIIMNIETTQD